jgi:hypothetical protein
MAESIMRRDGSDKFIAYSAGSDPKGQINPWAIKTLEAYGYLLIGFIQKVGKNFQSLMPQN